MGKDKEGQWPPEIVGVWRKSGQWDKAIAAYRILLTVEAEKYCDWYWGIANCYERSGRLKEAIHSYRQSDRYTGMYFAMASCVRRLKQYKEALVLLIRRERMRGLPLKLLSKYQRLMGNQADVRMPLNGFSKSVSFIPKLAKQVVLMPISKANTKSSLPWVGQMKRNRIELFEVIKLVNFK